MDKLPVAVFFIVVLTALTDCNAVSTYKSRALGIRFVI